MASSLGAQTLPQVVERALQVYPSIQSANAKAEAARTDIDKARSAHQPQIGVNLTTNRYNSCLLYTSDAADDREV